MEGLFGTEYLKVLDSKSFDRLMLSFHGYISFRFLNMMSWFHKQLKAKMAMLASEDLV